MANLIKRAQVRLHGLEEGGWDLVTSGFRAALFFTRTLTSRRYRAKVADAYPDCDRMFEGFCSCAALDVDAKLR